MFFFKILKGPAKPTHDELLCSGVCVCVAIKPQLKKVMMPMRFQVSEFFSAC